MIKYIFNILNKHPTEKGLTYIQHFCISFIIAKTFLFASLLALIHSIFPFLFETSSTDTIIYLQNFMTNIDKNTKINDNIDKNI